MIAWTIKRWRDATPHVRVAVIAHRKELIEQNAAEAMGVMPDADIGIYSAALNRRDFDANILFASIDSVHRRGGEFAPFDVIMVDECFVAGTLVAMSDGSSKPIEEVKVGDFVLNAFGRDYVSEVSRSETLELFKVELDNGIEIECTGAHPFFTSNGWVNAEDLEQRSRIASIQDMPVLWQEISALAEDSRRKDAIQVQEEFIREAEILQRILCEEARKPNAQSCIERKNAAVSTSYWTLPDCARREWERFNEAAEGVIQLPASGPWLDSGAISANTNETERRLPLPLQAGSRQSNENDSYRGGRGNALREEVDAGRKEGWCTGWARVERVTRKELTRPRAMFNIGISGHPSYFANGSLVHNCHRIPPGGEGKYRKFIAECRRFSPKLIVVGWTATPFRMNCGAICHKDHILNEVCYEASLSDLIDDGYLCGLRSKVGKSSPDLKGVRRNKGGDYIVKSLSGAANREEIVNAAVKEAVYHMNNEGRKSAVFFCVDVEHCNSVSRALMRNGVYAPVVTGCTNEVTRDARSETFRSGKLRAICNVNVYTEGFNAKCVDCIVLLRPTLSAGLFSQMVGRGLRLYPGKTDCLVLDFAGCISEHGPIDCLGDDRVQMAVCDACRESFSRAVRTCPACGWRIPKAVMERMEASDNERRLHAQRAAELEILSKYPNVHKVDAVYVSRHRKADNPDSVLVQYRCGQSMYREWVCLDHDGLAGHKAKSWWMRRFQPSDTGNSRFSIPSVDKALEDMFLTRDLLAWTKTISVKKNGRYNDIVGYNEDTTSE